MSEADTKKCPHCAEMVQAAAKVCKHCGKGLGRSFWKTFFLIAGICFVLSFVGCVAFCGSVATRMSEKMEIGAKDAMTLSKFSKIQTGMSYSEVCKIAGKEGKLMSETDSYSTKLYAWYGVDGISNMTGTFQNGYLVTKAQLALTDPSNQ